MGIVSFESVYSACNQIAAEGVYPTRELVRERLGGGSPNIIAPILKRWKDEHPRDVNVAPAIAIPGRIKDMAEQFLQRWWAEAVSTADDSLESNQIGILVAENEALRQQLDDYKKLQGFIEGQDNLASQLMTEIQKLTLENAGLKEGIAPEQMNIVEDLRQQLSDKNAELSTLQKHIQELRQQVGILENNIQILALQKQELEQESSDLRIQNATLSIKDEEINQLKAQVKKLESDVPRRGLIPIEVDELPQLAQQNVQLLAEIEQLKANIDQQEKALYLASLPLGLDKDIVQHTNVQSTQAAKDTENTNVQNVLVQVQDTQDTNVQNVQEQPVQDLSVQDVQDVQDTNNTSVQKVQNLQDLQLASGMWVQLAPGSILSPKQEVAPGNFFQVKSVGPKHAKLSLDGSSTYQLKNYRSCIVAVFGADCSIKPSAGSWVRSK